MLIYDYNYIYCDNMVAIYYTHFVYTYSHTQLGHTTTNNKPNRLALVYA